MPNSQTEMVVERSGDGREWWGVGGFRWEQVLEIRKVVEASG